MKRERFCCRRECNGLGGNIQISDSRIEALRSQINMDGDISRCLFIFSYLTMFPVTFLHL